MRKIACQTGFTLIELIITVAIVGIIATIGIPSFSQSITNSRLTTQANSLLTAINYARSEAIKRGVQVTIRRKGSTSKHWESGWDIFVDSDGSNVFNDDSDSSLCETNSDGSPQEDCLLKTYNALPSGFTLITGNSTAKDYIAYQPSGILKGSVGDTFRLCKDADTTKSRAIVINTVGRAYVQSPADACS